MIDSDIKTARPRREQTTISDLFQGIIMKPKETTMRHEQLRNFIEFWYTLQMSSATACKLTFGNMFWTFNK